MAHSVFKVAVCNLASIALNMYVRQDRSYDFKKLYEVTKVVTKNLNMIIDINCYPVPEVIGDFLVIITYTVCQATYVKSWHSLLTSFNVQLLYSIVHFVGRSIE